jgi:hypothetical protein
MTESDLQYAAGFIDADGCILIERSREKRTAYGIRHVPRVNAAGIDKRPLLFLRGLFGGHTMEQRRQQNTCLAMEHHGSARH